MKKAIRDHWYAYGRTCGFLTTHARLVEEVKGPAVPLMDLDFYCDYCRSYQTETSPCEHYQLFSWLEEGVAEAKQVYEQKDLDLIEDLGRAAGFTSRRPPRNDPWVSAWRDGAEAKLHGEVFRRFIRGWLQTGVDRRRVKGV